MWRNSYLRPRIFGLDGRVFFILIGFFFYARLWTLEVLSVACVILVFIEVWRGITIEVAWRSIRAFFAGKNRPGRLEDKYIRAVDYGYYDWTKYRDEHGL